MAQRTHPDDRAFAVEVTILKAYPAKIRPFATKADAEAWIAEHRRRVQSENEPGRWFCKSSTGSSSSWVVTRLPASQNFLGAANTRKKVFR